MLLFPLLAALCYTETPPSSEPLAASLTALAMASASSTAAELPAAFDLRSVDGINPLGPIRNHHLPIGSHCASCWSVTTATVLSARLNLAWARAGSARRVQLSAQYLLNCVPGQERCGYPGSAGRAMEYVSEHGMPSEACAPWQNAKFPCDPLHVCAARHHNGTFVPVSPTLYAVSSTLEKTPARDTEAMRRAILDGPIACGIHAEGLLKYKGGVLVDDDGGKTSDDHSVAVVGWGTDEHAGPYWIVQNNWGTEWGEGGFVRLRRGVNLLGIESGCHALKVKLPD